jgi:hypothetical protein
MTVSGCAAISDWFTQFQAAEPEFRIELRALVEAPDLRLDAIAELIGRHEPEFGETLRQEFTELPRYVPWAIFRAWLDATDAGVPFRLVSIPPDQPIEDARRRRIRLATDIEEEGIIVRLSHVPGHHPTGA